MISNEDIKTFSPTDQKHWRQWLQDNHFVEKSVWLIYFKKKSKIATITWSEAVDEALCFGWIDSLARPLDGDRYMQFFTKRKPNSVWSKINKEKVRKLIDEGKMSKAGLDVIELAKQNGSWTILDEVEELIIPADLENEFVSKPNAKIYFHTLSKSDKRFLLQWLVMAKRPETRQKRMDEIVSFTDQNLKPPILPGAKKPVK